MIYEHKHDRNVDLGETIPHLHIDLEKAVETHTIRDTGVIPEFNGIEDSSDVGPVVRDIFTAIDEKNRISQQMSDIKQQQQQQQQQQQTSTTQSE